MRRLRRNRASASVYFLKGRAADCDNFPGCRGEGTLTYTNYSEPASDISVTSAMVGVEASDYRTAARADRSGQRADVGPTSCRQSPIDRQEEESCEGLGALARVPRCLYRKYWGPFAACGVGTGRRHVRRNRQR
jgi:hypothetical protein